MCSQVHSGVKFEATIPPASDSGVHRASAPALYELNI